MKFVSLITALALTFNARAEEKAEGDHDFVNVKTVAEGVVVDLKYATDENFFKKKFYPTNECFLRRSTALKLARAQRDLEKLGFGLKIFDGYRPPSVQREMWAAKPDPRYVASPVKGSRHNRGAAVDVTLVDKKGAELPMPTQFDDFSEKAGSYFAELPEAVLENRRILQKAMTDNGFEILRSEWWHFDDSNWRRFPIEERAVGDRAEPHSEALPDSETLSTLTEHQAGVEIGRDVQCGSLTTRARREERAGEHP